MVEEFTDRENEIAEHLCLGKSQKMIAADLYIDPDTVHAHLRNMRKKIGGHTAIDIVREYILSIKDPKQYFAALIMLVLQFAIIFTNIVMDARAIRTPRLSKIEIEMIMTRGRASKNRRLC